MEALISIIVPVYNAEATLCRCIDALLGQSYQNTEIILVNDGSRDGSLAICQAYAARDSRVQVIDKPNGGVSSARNAGLDLAKGEFVMFCDSDDWTDPQWCEVLLRNFHPGLLTMGGCFVEGEQDSLPPQIKAPEGNQIYPKASFFDLYLSCFYAPWNKIYSRAVIEENHLRFHLQLKNGEDGLFNIQYLASIPGDVLFLDQCLLHYSWPTGNSLSSKADPKDFERSVILYEAMLPEIAKFADLDTLPLRFYQTFFWRFEKVLRSAALASDSWKLGLGKMKNLMANGAYQDVARRVREDQNRIYGRLCCRKEPLGLFLWYRMSGWLQIRREM